MFFIPGHRMKDHTFTLGIEEEFAIVDPETRELRSHIHEILEGGKVTLKEQIKPEMHQSVVELGHRDLPFDRLCARSRHRTAQQTGRAGRSQRTKDRVVGTHPFSHWHDQLITEGERYQEIVKDMQSLARANLIFGLHVHVGIPDRETAIHVMNQARYFLPHIYALSVNSPFWVGRNTGLKGYRLKVFERFPRTGIPDAFESLSEYEDYCKLLVKTGCIDNAKENLVGHPACIRFSTRSRCACAMRNRASTIRSRSRRLIQAVIAKLYKLLRPKHDLPRLSPPSCSMKIAGAHRAMESTAN